MPLVSTKFETNSVMACSSQSTQVLRSLDTAIRAARQASPLENGRIRLAQHLIPPAVIVGVERLGDFPCPDVVGVETIQAVRLVDGFELVRELRAIFIGLHLLAD